MESAINKVVYMAHPLGDGEQRAVNVLNASQWFGFLCSNFKVAVTADWILIASIWKEDRRELGLEIDKAIVRKCDEIWLVGGRISPGMAIERDVAISCGITVRDLTGFGYTVPVDASGIAEIVGTDLMRLAA